jgi:hypothetical protein
VKLLDRHETVLVIIGTGGARPEHDRRLAERLQQDIDRRGEGLTYRRAVLLSDDSFLRRPGLQHHPTIAVGGPGVNAVAHYYAASLPTVWREEERSFVQAELEDGAQRVALWGMDAATTARAVHAFVSQGFLDAMLERIWRLRLDQVM